MITIDILTLFPDMFHAPLGTSIIGRAEQAGHVALRYHQIRDFTQNKQNQVDDYPYGGGSGCVMQVDPLYRGWEHVKNLDSRPIHTIYFSPRGKVFAQQDAVRLAELAQSDTRLVFVCGHYEGVDERFIDTCVDEQISLGDFVLTGGEIPAMAVADAVCRMVPGVLSSSVSFEEESHFRGLLEYPQYSRPAVWQGQHVPEVLQNGSHEKINGWRRTQSFLLTILHRPDMFARLLFTKQDLKLLDKLRLESDDPRIQHALSPIHTGRITVRETSEKDAKYRTIDIPPGHVDYSIYADGFGFCGNIVYTLKGDTAHLTTHTLPHAQGRFLDTFAVAFVLDELFAQEAIRQVVLTNPIENMLCRFHAVLHQPITRKAWQTRRESC